MEINEIVVLLTTISGVMVTIAGVFLGYVKAQEKSARSERETAAKIAKEEREEHSRILAKSLEMLGNNLKENTESNKLIASETKRSADEAKERNGHLAELQLQGQEMFGKIGARNFAETTKVLEAVKEICDVKTKEISNGTNTKRRTTKKSTK